MYYISGWLLGVSLMPGVRLRVSVISMNPVYAESVCSSVRRPCSASCLAMSSYLHRTRSHLCWHPFLSYKSSSFSSGS